VQLDLCKNKLIYLIQVFLIGIYESLNIYLSNINWDFDFFGPKSVNDNHNKFCEIVLEAVPYFAPKTNASKIKKSNHLSYLNRQKHKLWKADHKNVAKYKSCIIEIKQRPLKHEQSILDSGIVNKIFSYWYVKNILKSNQGSVESKLENLAWDNQEKLKYFLISFYHIKWWKASFQTSNL